MAFLDFFKPSIAKAKPQPLSFSEPIFLKEDNSTEKQLQELKRWKDCVVKEQQELLEQDIKMLASGISGENAIVYELKNSYLPLLILQNLHFKIGDNSAQIDFVVISINCILVIECKKLLYDIEITSKGDFNRCFKSKNGTIYKKEGFYSPITQNQRHIEMVRKLLSAHLDGFNPQKYQNLLQSVVVLANPKTVVQDSQAPKEIRDNIIKCDQLISYIKNLQQKNAITFLEEQEMRAVADILLQQHIDTPTNYVKNYRFSVPVCPKCKIPMVKRKAQKGANAGKEFWGCAHYPHCRQIINIE